jgi:hypothetical protein
MLILKIILVEETRENLATTIPPTIVTIRKIKLVTIEERRYILSGSAETKRSKRRMIIKFLMMLIWLRRILILYPWFPICILA